jgi:hypothetical protein
MDCVYLNDAGNGLDTDAHGNVTGIDSHSSSDECSQSHGLWVDGRVNTIYYDPNSNAVALTGTITVGSGNDQTLQMTYSPIYNASATTVTVNANANDPMTLVDPFGSAGMYINPQPGYAYQGTLHLVQEPASPGTYLWGTIKSWFNCWAMDSPTAHIGPKPPEPSKPTDTVPNKAADLSVSSKSGRQLSRNVGNPGAAEGMVTAGDAAGMANDIANCTGGK